MTPQLIRPHEAPAHDPPPGLRPIEACPICGVWGADHALDDMPSLADPAARAVVRKLLKQALDKLARGSGLYAEASLIAGWLNVPIPTTAALPDDAPPEVVADQAVIDTELLIQKIMAANKFPRVLAERFASGLIEKNGGVIDPAWLQRDS